MIYLITGVPGSGKTLYAVSTLLAKLRSEKVKGKDGVEFERRLIVDGIPDLVIPHELMAVRPEDVMVNVTGKGPVLVPGPVADGEHGLWNWFSWCKAGDIIVCDEVQRYWRPRGLGVKPPVEIAALETHRHLGIDFVLITQNPMLLDQNVRRLVGRHQHVRRILGLARAMIYEWDGCSADVHRTGNATSTMWAFPKSAYKLYKSAEVHTKQRFKIPAWLAIPALAVVGGILISPRLWATASEVVTGKGVPSSLAVSVPAPAASGVRPSVSPVASSVLPLSGASAGQVGAAVVEPVLSGCIAGRGLRRCYDSSGRPVEPSDLELAAFMASRSDFRPSSVVADLPVRDNLPLASWVHRSPPVLPSK